MSSIEDFNRIDDCDKTDAQCINAFSEATLEDSTLCVKTSWGEDCIDLAPVVKENETLTTLYLSPEGSPNCLVYEPERGDNVCITGDNLSRIISMTKLKDVDQETPITDGHVYIYSGTTNKFVPYDLAAAINNLNVAVQNLQAAITNLQNRVTNIEEKITPPEGTPSDARIAYASINLYSDYNASVDSQGAATSLDKTHGIYGHSLNTDTDYDELLG